MLHCANQGADVEVPCTGMADGGSNEYEGDPDQTRPDLPRPVPIPIPAIFAARKIIISHPHPHPHSSHAHFFLLSAVKRGKPYIVSHAIRDMPLSNRRHESQTVALLSISSSAFRGERARTDTSKDVKYSCPSIDV
jgi:hypothetical protein